MFELRAAISVLRPYSSRLLTTPSDLAPMSTRISSLSMRTTVPSTTSPCLRLRISPACSLSSSSIVVGSGRSSTTRRRLGGRRGARRSAALRPRQRAHPRVSRRPRRARRALGASSARRPRPQRRLVGSGSSAVGSTAARRVGSAASDLGGDRSAASRRRLLTARAASPSVGSVGSRSATASAAWQLGRGGSSASAAVGGLGRRRPRRPRPRPRRSRRRPRRVGCGGARPSAAASAASARELGVPACRLRRPAASVGVDAVDRWRCSSPRRRGRAVGLGVAPRSRRLGRVLLSTVNVVVSSDR